MEEKDDIVKFCLSPPSDQTHQAPVKTGKGEDGFVTWGWLWFYWLGLKSNPSSEYMKNSQGVSETQAVV